MLGITNFCYIPLVVLLLSLRGIVVEIHVRFSDLFFSFLFYLLVVGSFYLS